jgi:hypothetical protein
MLRDFAFVAASGRLPPTGPVPCKTCAQPMKIDPVSSQLVADIYSFSGRSRA